MLHLWTHLQYGFGCCCQLYEHIDRKQVVHCLHHFVLPIWTTHGLARSSLSSGRHAESGTLELGAHFWANARFHHACIGVALECLQDCEECRTHPEALLKGEVDGVQEPHAMMQTHADQLDCLHWNLPAPGISCISSYEIKWQGKESIATNDSL